MEGVHAIPGCGSLALFNDSPDLQFEVEGAIRIDKRACRSAGLCFCVGHRAAPVVIVCGYKGSTARFQTLVTQTGFTGKYAPGGVRTQAYQRVDQQGLLQNSASSTDLAIMGSGFYAIDRKLRARFDDFPAITADDKFIRNLTRPDERRVVDDCYAVINMPETFGDLHQMDDGRAA